MPKPRGYWVIISGNLPTAFRSKRRDDLVPTLKQLQRKHPSSVLKWFERGRLWSSQLEADDALKLARQQRERRNSDWRPGGDHKDPRAKFEISRDEKRARFKRRLVRSKRQAQDRSSWGPSAPGPRDGSDTGPRHPGPKPPHRRDARRAVDGWNHRPQSRRSPRKN